MKASRDAARRFAAGRLGRHAAFCPLGSGALSRRLAAARSAVRAAHARVSRLRSSLAQRARHGRRPGRRPRLARGGRSRPGGGLAAQRRVRHLDDPRVRVRPARRCRIDRLEPHAAEAQPRSVRVGARRCGARGRLADRGARDARKGSGSRTIAICKRRKRSRSTEPNADSPRCMRSNSRSRTCSSITRA